MSELDGRFALSMFFAVLAAVGAALLANVVQEMTAPEWRANHEFFETRCTILAKYVAERSQEGQPRYRPEFKVRYDSGKGPVETIATFDAAAVFITDREPCEENLAEFEVGQEYLCWYDPHEPTTVVLRRGYSWIAWVVPLLPAAFVAVGVGGLIYVFLTWGKSAERRAMLQQSAGADIFDTFPGRFPTVPSDRDVTNSPGTTLKYRIPNAAPGWNVLFLLFVAVGWNTLVGWFVFRAVNESLAGKADFLLWFGLVPFLIAGGYFAYLAGRALMIVGGIEPTLVEISSHPLYPGGRYEVFLSQPGRNNFQKLSVILVCDEEATFRQGTNSRTHVQRVVEVEVFRREAFSVQRGEPFQVRFELHVPEAAMHSFQSPHNSVKWKLLVRGELANWPDFERAFMLLVYPGRNGVPYA
ncbi:MAG: hypothetical protein J0M17_08225 [Planctomycetes bacterium]|nr:hypothetical protein [Planctomycetota bacterium]